MSAKEKRYTFTHYLCGALPARLGDKMSAQAILLLGLGAAHTVSLGSILLAGLTISAAVGGPLLGALLDKTKQPGRVLAAAIALHALGVTCIALTLGRIPAWLSVTCAVAAGFFLPAISGGWSSRLKSFTNEERMPRASAIDAFTFNITGLAGPALAGLIAAWAGAGWAVAILVTLLVAALPMAWRLPKRPHTEHSNKSFAHTVSAGFKTIITNRALLRITVVSMTSFTGMGMVWVICPLLGREVFDNAGYGGVLMSILSACALVASLAYAKWPTRLSPDTIAFATTILLIMAMFLLLAADNALFVIAAMCLAGIADGPQLAAIFTVRNREAPEHTRSQVFTTGASLKFTGAAIGAALAGYIAAHFSLDWTIFAAALVQASAALAYLVLSRGSRITS